MHRSREKLKMVEGDGGRFLGNHALEFFEISWECYHHPNASPHETIFRWMHGYRENAKMAIGDGGLFLENCALEFSEIA